MATTMVIIDGLVHKSGAVELSLSIDLLDCVWQSAN